MEDGDKAYLFRSDWLLASLVKLLDGLLVVSQILLTSNKNGWETAAEMQHFRNPLDKHVSASSFIIDVVETNLLLNIVEGIRRIDGETDEDDM